MHDWNFYLACASINRLPYLSVYEVSVDFYNLNFDKFNDNYLIWNDPIVFVKILWSVLAYIQQHKLNLKPVQHC